MRRCVADVIEFQAVRTNRDGRKFRAVVFRSAGKFPRFIYFFPAIKIYKVVMQIVKFSVVTCDKKC